MKTQNTVMCFTFDIVEYRLEQIFLRSQLNVRITVSCFKISCQNNGNEARLDKSRQDKTRQDKTRQDKTRHVRYSAVLTVLHHSLLPDCTCSLSESHTFLCARCALRSEVRSIPLTPRDSHAHLNTVIVWYDML
jgi:hypothetical protein